MRKELGYIQKAEYGFDPDRPQYMALWVTLESKGWGVCAYKGDPDEVKKVLQSAGKNYVSQLKGVPVEVTFEGMVLSSWRVLTEVIGK